MFRHCVNGFAASMGTNGNWILNPFPRHVTSVFFEENTFFFCFRVISCFISVPSHVNVKDERTRKNDGLLFCTNPRYYPKILSLLFWCESFVKCSVRLLEHINFFPGRFFFSSSKHCAKYFCGTKSICRSKLLGKKTWNVFSGICMFLCLASSQSKAIGFLWRGCHAGTFWKAWFFFVMSRYVFIDRVLLRFCASNRKWEPVRSDSVWAGNWEKVGPRTTLDRSEESFKPVDENSDSGVARHGKWMIICRSLVWTSGFLCINALTCFPFSWHSSEFILIGRRCQRASSFRIAFQPFFLLLHLRTVCRLRVSAGANLLLSQADREDKLYESLVYSRMDRVYQTPQRVSRGGRKDEAEKLESFVQASDNPVICLSEASHTSDLKARNVKLLLHPFSLARSLTHSDFPSAFFVAALDVFSLERLSISLFISRLLKINKTTEDAHVLGFFLPPSHFSKLGFDRRHFLSAGALFFHSSLDWICLPLHLLCK